MAIAIRYEFFRQEEPYNLLKEISQEALRRGMGIQMELGMIKRNVRLRFSITE